MCVRGRHACVKLRPHVLTGSSACSQALSQTHTDGNKHGNKHKPETHRQTKDMHRQTHRHKMEARRHTGNEWTHKCTKRRHIHEQSNTQRYAHADAHAHTGITVAKSWAKYKVFSYIYSKLLGHYIQKMGYKLTNMYMEAFPLTTFSALLKAALLFKAHFVLS